MIKKIVIIIFPIISLLGLFYYMKSSNTSLPEIQNVKKVPLELKGNSIQCSKCSMFLVGKKFTAQIIIKNNKTHFFDDPGCAALWLCLLYTSPSPRD